MSIERKPLKFHSSFFMPKVKHRLVETPMGSTIDSLSEGGYLVCDRDHNCREVLKLWEADDCLREQENGFDYPYATNFRPARWIPTTHVSLQRRLAIGGPTHHRDDFIDSPCKRYF